MMDRDRHDCLRCDRTFLSEEALERHYDRNPDHAERFVIDADAIESDAATLPGGEWLETDETVETFITIAAPTSPADDSAAGEPSAGEDTPSGGADESPGEDGGAAGGGNAANVEMTYDPGAESLVIHGVRDRELDLSGFWEAVDGAVTWSFDGTYHKLQFYKDDDR